MKTLRPSFIAIAVLLSAISGCESCSKSGPYQSTPVIVIDYPPTTSAVFSPDNKYFATASLDDNVRLWKNESSTNPQPIATLFHRGEVNSSEFSKDSKRLATKSAGAYYVWAVEPGANPKPLSSGPKPDFASGYQEDVFPIYSPDRKTHLTQTDTEILWWKSELPETIPEHLGEQGHVTFSRNSQLIGIGASLWSNDANGPKRIKNFESNPKTRCSIAGFSEDAKFVATFCFEDMNVKTTIWQLEGLKELQSVATFASEEKVESDYFVAFSPDGKSLAIPAGEKLNIWRLKE